MTKDNFIRPLSEKEKAFLEKWKIKRKNKWRYILIHGVLSFTLPLSMLNYFTLSDLSLWKLIATAFLNILFGLLLGYWFYYSQDKRFKEVYPDFK